MEKKRPVLIAVHRLKTTSLKRWSDGKTETGENFGYRVYLHGACTVTFLRSPRDHSLWKVEGRRRLFSTREPGPGRWTDKYLIDRLNSAVFARDPWRREMPSSSPSGDDGRGRKPSGGKSIIMSWEEKPIDQRGSFVGRVSGVGANR